MHVCVCVCVSENIHIICTSAQLTLLSLSLSLTHFVHKHTHTHTHAVNVERVSHVSDIHVSSSAYDMHISSSSYDTQTQSTSRECPMCRTYMYPPPHMLCMYPPPHTTHKRSQRRESVPCVGHRACRQCGFSNEREEIRSPFDSRQSPPPLQTWRRAPPRSPAPVSTGGRCGVGRSSDGHDERCRIVLPPETVEQPSLSSGLSDAPWLNRRRPGSPL
jgi:hypothetical protein